MDLSIINDCYDFIDSSIDEDLVITEEYVFHNHQILNYKDQLGCSSDHFHQEYFPSPFIHLRQIKIIHAFIVSLCLSDDILDEAFVKH